jgi:hypothetical protein
MFPLLLPQSQRRQRLSRGIFDRRVGEDAVFPRALAKVFTELIVRHGLRAILDFVLNDENNGCPTL